MYLLEQNGETNMATEINPNSIGWMQGLLQGFAQYSQVFNKAVLGTFGSLAASLDLYGIYQTYQNREMRQQRKTKLASFAASFSLNALYTLGAILKFLSALALNTICIGIDLVTLARASYVTHQARKAVATTKEEMKRVVESHEPNNASARFQRAEFGSLSHRLEAERKHRFKSKIEVGFTAASALTSCLFTAGLFFPPLFAVAVGAFVAMKVVQIIDSKIDNKISRWIGNLWNKITGKHKSEKPAPAADYSEKLLDDSENMPESPKVVAKKQKQSIPVINTTFARQQHQPLANHARLFSQPAIVFAEKTRNTAESKPRLFRIA
jgi:uncharacterized membrane protein